MTMLGHTVLRCLVCWRISYSPCRRCCGGNLLHHEFLTIDQIGQIVRQRRLW